MLQKVVREGLTFDDVLLVPHRSEVLPKDVDFYEVAKTVHRRYGAKEYQYRLWEDIPAGELAPYAMAHWIKEKRQKKLEDVEGRASYLGLTLD